MLPFLGALAWEGLISSLAKFGLQGWFVRFANVLSSEGMGGAVGTAFLFGFNHSLSLANVLSVLAHILVALGRILILLAHILFYLALILSIVLSIFGVLEPIMFYLVAIMGGLEVIIK